MSNEPFLAWALNSEPLTKHQGSPLRLLVPGWYGVANVKWLSQIHIQEEQFLGKFQARWYRTVRGEMIDGEMKWNETAVTHMQLKSFIARVTTDGTRYKVLGVVLNDGTPIKSVDVRIDEAMGKAEVTNALQMLSELPDRVGRRTLAGDKGYDTKEFVQWTRAMNITPHIAKNEYPGRSSALDDRTTRHAGYEVSQRIRKRVEEIFGWTKTVGNFRRTRYKGQARTSMASFFVGAAYNLLRMGRLMARPA